MTIATPRCQRRVRPHRTVWRVNPRDRNRRVPFPRPLAIWKLAKQAGVDLAVGGLPFDDAERHRRAVGLHAAAAHEAALRERRLQAGRDRGAAAAQQGQARPAGARRGDRHRLHAAREHGQARHPGLVLRVDDRLQLAAHQHQHALARRLGRHQLRQRAAARRAADRTRPDRRRGALGRTSNTSCAAVVPVAEKANVKLAMHPDDPPLSPIRGVAASCAASRTTSACSTWCPAR